MQAEGHEHGADGEVKPLDPSRRKFLVDPFLNFENQSSLGVNEPCSDLVTSSKVGENAVVDGLGIGMKLQLGFFDPLKNLRAIPTLVDFVL